jgi:hypothetical protein
MICIRRGLMHYSDNIDDIRKEIIRFAGSPEKARAFIEELAATDWESLERCQCCFETIGRDGLLLVEKEHYWRGKKLCTGCIQHIRSREPFDCVVCGDWHDKRDLCDLCRAKYKPEISRVREHIARTSALGLISNLTIGQWLATLDHFEWKCAYSPNHRFENLEHYLSVSLGGGTTANNCVPSCLRCNVKKHDRHPDQLHKYFPADNLARIREYLASVAMKQLA